MADRELLELAAKAAGIEVTAVVADGIPNRFGGGYWNPLTSDGDALRLAVKLGLLVRVNLDDLFVRVICEESLTAPVHSEALGADPYAATRRAIVRAAAEIGRSMK